MMMILLLTHNYLSISQENWEGKLVFLKYFKDANIIYMRAILYVLRIAIVENHLLIRFC